jgi:hypothetical protein
LGPRNNYGNYPQTFKANSSVFKTFVGFTGIEPAVR